MFPRDKGTLFVKLDDSDTKLVMSFESERMEGDVSDNSEIYKLRQLVSATLPLVPVSTKLTFDKVVVEAGASEEARFSPS